MGLYLVRHAHAGRRSAWKGNDAERPLSDRGRAQAAGILDLIPVRVTAVLSSPAVRCVQTVEAVAERAGLPLQLEAGLFEGSDTARTAKQLRHLLREDAERAYSGYVEMLNEDEQGTAVNPARRGLARELARMNLSLNFYTQWYWKTDLHNLLNFLSLRADSHAQYEIRVYADAMIDTVDR